MSDLCQRMREIEWTWGDKDPNALSALEQRIAEAGRQLALITYSDLVRESISTCPTCGMAGLIVSRYMTGLDSIGGWWAIFSVTSPCVVIASTASWLVLWL